ncbi:methionine aminopeptidase 2a [Phtheirospermum japonicum]|uniref:Methionine aminopeptidase 2a n=1 Tax=Phtheirospermum japonicum TaxID=374723 RepID=A0A830CRX0_9LAMI|nr:methionine aminopeptidase 2a [Phtheirospermum japonicum]
MTALPRLLEAGIVPQNVMGKVEIGHQKLAAQYIRREIQEVDEANLLDEEGCSLNLVAAHWTPNTGDKTVLQYDD